MRWLKPSEADLISFLIVILFLAWASLACAESFHDESMHDLAHFGGGTIAAEFAHSTDSSLKPWQRRTFEITAACAVNVLYECWESKEGQIMVERVAAGTLGGVVFSWGFH